jgi:Tfp pilus assembly protein FimV
MFWMLLTAVVATDVAVAVLFVTMRRHLFTQQAPVVDETFALEMEAVVQELRAEAEQAVAEIGREKAQLRRMLSEIERQQATQVIAPAPVQAPRPAPAPAPIYTHRDVLRLAGEGHSFRAIAMRTGMSVEEVRLMLAMEQEAA